MKIILIGASGTIGQAVARTLQESGHELVKVGRSTGEFRVKIEERASVRELFLKLGSFDAVVVAAGEVDFAPLEKLGDVEWKHSFGSKFLGQVHVVQEGLAFIRDRGSFTLVSGILSGEPILGGVAASSVNRAIEGFVMAAAAELPRGIRLNAVSPTVLEESMEKYADFFPGFEPVSGARVGDAFLKAVSGLATGQTIRVGW